MKAEAQIPKPKSQFPSKVDDSANEEKLAELVAHVGRGGTEKPEAREVATLGEALETHPGMLRKVSEINQVTRKLILIGFPAGLHDSIRGELESIQHGLGYSEAAEIERLLIEQVGTCWLQVQLTQLGYTAITGESIPIERADHWERRLTGAQRRYTRAIEALARVRRLRRRGAAQVNIGMQQMNMVGLTPSPSPDEEPVGRGE